jgi:hypothetical protein
MPRVSRFDHNEPLIRAAQARAFVRRQRFAVLRWVREAVAVGAWPAEALHAPNVTRMRVLAVCSPETIAAFDLLEVAS